MVFDSLNAPHHFSIVSKHMCGQVHNNSHMFAVALCDLVSDGVLVRQVLIVKEVLPALGIIKVSDLS